MHDVDVSEVILLNNRCRECRSIVLRGRRFSGALVALAAPTVELDCYFKE